MFDNNFLKTKIKSYNVKIITNFNNNNNNNNNNNGNNNDNSKVHKEGSECICLSAIVTDSVFKSGKKYFSRDTSKGMQIQNLKKRDKIIHY